MNETIIRQLIDDLRQWRKRAFEVADALDAEAKTAEPVGIVLDKRYTVEGWAADMLRATLDEDVTETAITYLEGMLDRDAIFREVREAAESAERSASRQKAARETLTRILAGTEKPGDRANLRAAVEEVGAFQHPGALSRAAMYLDVDLEHLAAIFPDLATPRNLGTRGAELARRQTMATF